MVSRLLMDFHPSGRHFSGYGSSSSSTNEHQAERRVRCVDFFGLKMRSERPTRRIFLSAIGGSAFVGASEAQKSVWSVASGGFLFEWDFVSDRASVRAAHSQAPL